MELVSSVDDRYLTDEHRTIRDLVREFARERVAPVARDLDIRAEFPWENVVEMARMGLFGIPFPEECGGVGLDTLALLVVIEELAKVDASHAIAVGAHTSLCAAPIYLFGTEEQRHTYLTRLAAGKVLGGFGLTEPQAGSDAGASRTRALEKGDHWVLNGSKIFITHGGVGEIFVITAVTGGTDGNKEISSFILTKETCDLDRARAVGVGHDDTLTPIPGFRSGKKEDKLGWRASDTRELILEDAIVPKENLLGKRGEGFKNFLRTLDSGRIGMAALALGIAEGALERTLEYTGLRRQFGQRICDFQAVRFDLADIATGIEVGKHLTYHAATLKDQGKLFTKEASMAKLFCSELAMRASIKAVQLHGGYGYTTEYPVERMMRDAKICEIGEGTSEIQRLVIARQILGEPEEIIEGER